MRVLIPGSNGLLVQKIVRHLESLPEFQYVAASRGIRRFLINAPNIHYEFIGVLQFSHVKSILEKYKPEVLIHTAS